MLKVLYMWQDVALFFGKIIVPFLLIFNLIPLLIWMERKVCAYVQDRPGPNRAEIFGVRLGGLIHSLADVIKLISKRDIIPTHVNKTLFLIAPFITLFIACVTFVVIPFADTITVSGAPMLVQAAGAPIGLLYILSVSSVAVYGIMLAGWSSNNKYALLGTLRSSAQMVSYEIGMGLAIMGVVLLAGSFELNEIVRNQSQYPWYWNVVRQPVACILFIICAFAETNRAPFDLPEGESEIVAGYHLEYSSMKFAMFFMAEYANMIIASCLIASLFFGGWQVPFVSTEQLRSVANTGTTAILLAIGIGHIAIGTWLLRFYRSKTRQHYGDRRDKETLVLGVPAFAVGLLITLLAVLYGAFSWGPLGTQVFAALIQSAVFLAKVLFFCFIFILVRWTVPRFRYDQLMSLGWKGIIPLGILNIAITATLVYLIG